MDEKRLEALFAALSLLVQAKSAGHRVESEMNRIIGAIMRELNV